ncbi:MAG: hypothetical protein J5829_00935 [Lachnospiraceae bacterium]|nr:hypothetical protein [Lachnospiraceae bacterium]
MLLFIRSETANALKSRYARFYLAGIVLVSILANLSMVAFRDILYGTNDGTQAYNLIMFAGSFFWIPYYTMIFVADMVFGKEYPDPYLRNRANIRLKRYEQYLGKLLAGFVVLLLFVAAAFVIFIGISFIFQISAGSISVSVVGDFALTLVLSIPLFTTGLAFAFMFLFMFEDKKKAFAAFFILVVGIERLIMILGSEHVNIAVFAWIRENLLITPQFTTLQFYATRDVPKVIITSVLWTVVAAAAGCYCYLKNDTGKRCRRKTDEGRT